MTSRDRGARPATTVAAPAVPAPDGDRAERHLVEALTTVGAVVRVARLPGAPNGAKVGFDDYLFAHGPSALRALIEDARTTVDSTSTKGEGTKPSSAADVLTGIGVGIRPVARSDPAVHVRDGPGDTGRGC